MTLTHDREAKAAIARIMLGSYEAAVDSMMPLGLHHIMWPGHHYGPAPWWARDVRPDWNSVYYHRADERGVGFDRTETGSNAVSRYRPPVRRPLRRPGHLPRRIPALVPSRPLGPPHAIGPDALG